MNDPLWLPRGSVRAILALGLWIGLFALLFLEREIPRDIWAVGGMVIAFYFGTKASK